MLLVVVAKRFLVYYPCDIFNIAISRLNKKNKNTANKLKTQHNEQGKTHMYGI